MTPYQFVLLRYQHSATAGEIVNIGVVMWLPAERRLHTAISDRYGRLSQVFQPTFDSPSYSQMIRQVHSRFDQITREINGGQLDLLDAVPTGLDDILRVLVPDPDSCFRWSMVMAGGSPDPARRLRELFHEFIERHESFADRQKRDDDDIWDTVEAHLRRRDLLGSARVTTGYVVRSASYDYTFRAGWQNGIQQVLEPISFDLVHSSTVVEKATHWSGRLYELSRGDEFRLTAVIAPPQRQENMSAFQRARRILETAPSIRRVIEENQVEGFLLEIERDLRASAQESP